MYLGGATVVAVGWHSSAGRGATGRAQGEERAFCCALPSMPPMSLSNWSGAPGNGTALWEDQSPTQRSSPASTPIPSVLQGQAAAPEGQ